MNKKPRPTKKELEEKNKARNAEKLRKKAEQTKAKEEKIRRQGHRAFWYLIPGHLKKEASLTGGDFSFQNNLSDMIIFFGLTIIMSIIFNLSIPFIVLMCITTLLFYPVYMVQKYRRSYEEKRFQDINSYMEQFLYAFREQKKITASLRDIRPSFNSSPIGPMIDRALDKIMNPDMDSKDSNIEEIALKEIEHVYPTEKLLTIHKFALRVEKIGGNFNETSKLLLEDRTSWEARMNKEMAEKKQKQVLVNVSIALSIILCMFFLRVMSISIKDFDITRKLPVQISAVIIWFIDLIIFSVTNTKTSADILTLTTESEEVSAIRHYYRIENWDNKVEAIKSIRLAIVPAVLAILFYFLRHTLPFGVMGNLLFAFLSLGLTFLMLVQHKIDYKLTKKKVEDEVMALFPRWLIDMALLLQTDNVQVAMYKSYNEAPAVLMPELKKLYDELEKDPTSVEPYLHFMEKFDVRGLRSSMKMLYNIHTGSGADSDIQIKEIIERNNEMLEFAADAKAENQIGQYSGLVLCPILSAGFKLSLDMSVFFITMMSYLSTITSQGTFH